MGERLLTVDGLSTHFFTYAGVVKAVNGVSFTLDRKETLGIVGESGSGKTVAALSLMRLIPDPPGKIVEGSLMLGDRDLRKLSDEEIRQVRGNDIAMIFQDPMTSLNPVLTIREQMVETIQAHKKVSKDEAKARAVELLAMVGIPKPADRLNDFPHQFSGGMRQRVMIAMALALEPKLLIADEPTTALDVTIQAQVLELLKNLTTDRNTALVLITHDLGVVAGMTQRINVMYAGFIVETATTADLFAKPSHPYTVGLLHSVPRVDAAEGEALIPIEGRPPDMRHAPTGCPFAPRCAWRIETCWTQNPALTSVREGEQVVLTGDRATHRISCHNPPMPEEAAAGLPQRPGFAAAPPPPGYVDELAGRIDSSIDSEAELQGIWREEGPISMGPSAGALPLPPVEERHNDGL